MKKINLFLCLMISIAILSCKERANTNHVSNDDKIDNSIKKLTIKSSEDITIHFTKYGDQDNLIVFVHGWSCDQTYWREQIEFFKKKYQVVTVDLAGHGKSTKGNRKNWTILSLSNDLLKVLQRLKYHKVTLVGHSMGAMVAIEASLHLDKERTKVVAVDYLKRSLQKIPDEVAEGYFKKFRTDFENSTKEFVSKMFHLDSDSLLRNSIINDMSSAPKEIAIPLSRDLVTRDFSETIKMLVKKQIPKVIINSNISPVNESYYKELGFKVENLPGAGHFLMIEKPQSFNQLLNKNLHF